MSIFHADFDQIELRIAAALSGEPSMIKAAKCGESLHKSAAIKLFGEDYTPTQYGITKNGNFLWLYGGGPSKLSDTVGIPLEESKAFLSDYNQAFSVMTAYKRQRQKDVLRAALSPDELTMYYELRSHMWNCPDTPNGRKDKLALKVMLDALTRRKVAWITTPFGRRLPVEANKAYKVVNFEVQSTAAHIMGLALLDVMADPELEPTVLLPVHDELLGEAPIRKADYMARRYGEVMTREFREVPLTASGSVYGKSWGHGYMKKED